MTEARIIAGPGSRDYRVPQRRERYTAAAQGLHWLTALLMLAILPIAWHMTMLSRDDPARETWYTVHKSIGLSILALSILRIVWRASHQPPQLPLSMARVEVWLAKASHWALYVMLFAMPVSGYLISAGGGHPVSYFGLFDIPAVLPANPTLSKAGVTVHLVGQWAVYVLVVLHIAATAWHLVHRRDGILDTMLPRQHGG